MLIIISNSSKIIHRIILIKLKFNLINFFEFCDFNWLHSWMCSDEHILINKLTEHISFEYLHEYKLFEYVYEYMLFENVHKYIQ